MPIRVRNWADPLQRLLYYLDRDLDKLVKAIAPPEPRIGRILQNRIKPIVKHIPALTPETAPETTPEIPELVSEAIYSNIVGSCCAKPDKVYKADGHDWVCTNCGLCNHANFEEVGTVVQFEQRSNCAPLCSLFYPYDRNKHFKKILRDVTNMFIRVPKKLVAQMRSIIRGKVTVGKVRTFLRDRKLYHYYTSANNIARSLGDDSERIKLDSRAYSAMCVEADAVGRTFDRLRQSGIITRKNFVNTNVLILRIAIDKFKLPEIGKHLRLPRPATAKKHQELLDLIYEHM